MTAFYNDVEPYVLGWLKNLIEAKLISPGVVDGRDIRELKPADLVGYDRCHFFAGLAGWNRGLRLAGWPEDRPVWTGSCPCQPFSVAGKRRGTADERHLWPGFRDLIAQRQPPTVFGEQVASRDGREWLAGVRTDMEALGYVVGAADLCAAGVGAPHIRQRLYWVAVAQRDAQKSRWSPVQSGESSGTPSTRPSTESGRRSMLGRLGASSSTRLQVGGGDGSVQRETLESFQREASIGSSFWSDYDLIPCIDGKSRRIESGTFPLAHGVPDRVGKLRAYGNSIVSPLTATFIRAFLDAEADGFRDV